MCTRPLAKVMIPILAILVFGLPLLPARAEDAVTEMDVPLTTLNPDINRFMQGPLDEVSAGFSLPPEWVPAAAELQLDLRAYFGNLLASEGTSLPQDLVMGELSVKLNGLILLREYLQTAGDHSYSLVLPPEQFLSGTKGSLNHLQVQWNALASCPYQFTTGIQILESSKLSLSYSRAAPLPDLSTLPAPFYLENSLQPIGVSLVIPDQPTQTELQAALGVAAWFGSISGGAMQVNLVTASQLDYQTKQDHNLVLVGRLSNFSTPTFTNLLAAVPPGLSPDTGILSETSSPWNPYRLVLLVSGGTDTGLLKAARAVTSGKLLTGDGKELALVETVQTLPQVAYLPEVVDFENLGYKTLTRSSPGNNRVVVPFEIPAGIGISPDAYLDLVFSHSKLIDYQQSNLWVELNGTPIGSVRFSDQTSEPGSTRFLIPASALHPLANQLGIEINITPRDGCADPALGESWVTIFSDSSLHFPPMQQSTALATPYEISDYPRPFVFDTHLATTAFLLDQDDPESWNVAAGLAFDLGAETQGDSFTPAVFYSASVLDPAASGDNLIVIGLSSLASRLGGLNDDLPVPFNSRGEVAHPSQFEVGFSISANQSVGYLEMINLPDNPQHVLLVVLGSDVGGTLAAAQALVDPSIRLSSLDGNFALLQGEYVGALNFTGLGLTPVSPSAGVAVSPVSGAERLRLGILLGLAGALVFSALLVAIWLRQIAMRRKKGD